MQLMHEFPDYESARQFAESKNIDTSTISSQSNFVVEEEVQEDKFYEVTYDVYEHFGRQHHKIGTESMMLPQMPYMEMKAYINNTIRNRSPNLSIINLRVKERMEKLDAI